MKTKQGFNLRQMCGENIIVAEGEQNIDFSNIISMNESAAYLWTHVQTLPAFTLDKMVELMREEYEVDEETARTDCAALAATWGQAGIIEGDDIPQAALKPQATTAPQAASQPSAIAATPQESSAEASAAAVQQPHRKGFFARLLRK